MLENQCHFLAWPFKQRVDILMVICNSGKSLTTLRSWAQKDPTEWSTLQLVKSRLKEDDGAKEYQGIVYRTLKQVLNSVKPMFFLTFRGLKVAQRPLLLPEPYDGATGSWPEWEAHFENVAAVNNKRELYVAELQTRRRHKDEDWASFGDALRVLADKAYSDLEDNARERLALNQFLAQITNPQIAFGVKQKRPKTVEEAVVTTIELESYLGSTGERLHVNSTFPQPDSEQAAVGSATAVAAVSPRATDNSRDGEEGLAGILKALNERLHLLERLVENDRRPRQNKDVEQGKKRTRTNITCWKCGEKRTHRSVLPKP
eukprot:Em0004g1074a